MPRCPDPRTSSSEPGPSQDLPIAHPHVRRLPIVLTAASWLCNMSAFLFLCVWGERMAPIGLDLWSGIPDALIRVAFFAAFGCAVLAAGLGELALRYSRRPYAVAPRAAVARASFTTGEALAALHAAGLCIFLYLLAFCGQHC